MFVRGEDLEDYMLFFEGKGRREALKSTGGGWKSVSFFAGDNETSRNGMLLCCDIFEENCPQEGR